MNKTLKGIYMENLIEHKEKMYKVVQGGDCPDCAFGPIHMVDECNLVISGNGPFPNCEDTDCHFELVTETNQKE